MIRRTSIIFFEFLAGLAAGAMILTLVAWWWLSSGPITLTFLNPYIEEALSPSDSTVAVEIDDTVLVWAGWERAVDVRVSNLRVLDLDRKVVATMPQVSLGFSIRALFRGMLAPTYLEILNPRVSIVRNSDGKIAASLADDSAESTGQGENIVLASLVGELLAKPDPSQPWGYLRRVGIVDADLTVADHLLGRIWQAPQAVITMKRNTAGITADFVLELKQTGVSGRLAGLAEFRSDTGTIDATLDFSALEIAPFVTLINSPPLQKIALANRQADGTLKLAVLADGRIGAAAFNLQGAAGHFNGYINLDPQGIEYKSGITFEDLPSGLLVEAYPKIADWVKTDLPLSGVVAVSGAFDGYVETATFDLSGGAGALEIARILPEPFLLESFRLRGTIEDDGARINIAEATLDLPKGQVIMNASATRVGADWSVRFDARGSDIPTNDVRKYWPLDAAKSARKWVVPNLQQGTIRESRVSLVARITESDEIVTKIESLHGGLSVDGLEVNYFHPLPKATAARADVTFTADRFDIAVLGGRLRDMSVDSGTVVITDVSGYNPKIDIDITVRGPLRTALTVLDSQPLAFLDNLGLDPEAISGTTAARLLFEFPLSNALKVQQIAVAAGATLQDVSIDEGPMGIAMQNGALELKVTGEGISAGGDALLNGVPVKVSWNESFKKSNSYKRKVNVIGDVSQAARQALGLPDLPFLNGSVAADVMFTMAFDGRREVVVEADLQRASLDFPNLHWRKPPGSPGTVRAFAVVNADGGAVVEELKITAGDLKANARVELAPGSLDLQVLEFRSLQFAENELIGRIGFQDGKGYNIELTGKYIDISKFLSSEDEVDSVAVFDAKPLRVEARIAEVFLGDGQVLHDVRAVLDSTGTGWRFIDVDASVNDARLNIRYAPQGEGATLRISTNNAGDTLRALDWTKRVSGGNLLIAGNQTGPGMPMTGKFSLQEFKVSDAPALARILQVLSLTGIFSALNQSGLDFVRLDGEFQYYGGVVNVKNTRAFGSSIGITTEGVIVTDGNMIKLNGTVVPAYTINQVLGKIPILGQILTGGKNEGLFAANYALSGSFDDPQVSVNPLSALAPGFLRNLISVDVAPLDNTIPSGTD